MTRIVLDAMGGDHAPTIEVEGALLAARQLGVRITLVGPEPSLRQEFQRQGGQPEDAVELVQAPQVIGMDEPVVQAIRRKPQSSINVGMRLVRDGRADGFVSAGNTGAIMAAAKMVIKTVKRITRPALAAVVPTLTGQRALILDVGANAKCKPLHLLQFAMMGDVYARTVMGVTAPRVGLVSIGEEELKGNELTREAHKLLELSRLQFVGNVEGQGIYSGKVDVIVCDGFTGNVILKVSEGISEMLLRVLRQELVAGGAGSGVSPQAFEKIKRRFDYQESGGAPLLGVNNVCVICHGRSSGRAIANAIRMAADLCEKRVPERIGAEISKLNREGRVSRQGAEP